MNGPPLTGPDPQLQQLITPQGPAPNLPQPPQQPGGGPAAPGTLGDINQQMAPGNPLVEQYVQIAQALEQQLAPLKMPVQPRQPGPGLLESLGTFGLANLKHIADENTRREQNYIAIKNNRDISLKAAGMAQHMVDAQAAQGAIQQRLSLAQQRYITDLQDKLARQYHQQTNDAYKFETHPAPKTPDEATTLRALGFGPSQRFPGVWDRGGSGGTQLTPQPGGGWAPAAPGSAVEGALGAVETPPDQPKPGELPEQFARRQIIAGKGQEKTATEDAAAAAETMRNMKLVESWLKDPQWDQGVSLLPKATAAGAAESAVGPARAYYHQFKGTPGANYFATANTNVMPALRAMEAGAKNMRIAGAVLGDFGIKPQMSKLQNFRMSQSQAEDFKQTLLNRFKEIRKQLGTDTGDTSTTETTTSTTTPSSIAPSTMAPASLDELLKKHGY
jgi:hypothetical protein